MSVFCYRKILQKNCLHILISIQTYFLFRNSLFLLWNRKVLYIFFFVKLNLECLQLVVISLFLQLYLCETTSMQFLSFWTYVYFFLLIDVCKSAHHLPLLLYSKLSWCHIPKAQVSCYCLVQFIKHAEMTSARHKVPVALELTKTGLVIWNSN